MNNRNPEKFLIETFQIGVDNFNRSVSESEHNLPYYYLASIYDSLFDPKYWRNKPDQLQAYLLSYAHPIKYDYAKALQHLLQGYFSDHYFFIRRAIESVQFMLFLKDIMTSEIILSDYSQLSTNRFKSKYKYKNWFSSKKEHFNKEYNVSMQAYEEACSLGVHVSRERKSLFQKFEFRSQEELFITSTFHDCMGDPNDIDMVPIYTYKLHKVFWDIYRTIINERIFDVVTPKELTSRYNERFELCTEALKKYYEKLDPEGKRVSFAKR